MHYRRLVISRKLSHPQACRRCSGIDSLQAVILKCMHSLVTRNAIILCPHPAALECSNDAARMIAEVAEANGAPKGAIQWLEKPPIEQVGRLSKVRQN